MNGIEMNEVIDLEDEHTWTVVGISDYGVKLQSETGSVIEFSWEEMGI